MGVQFIEAGRVRLSDRALSRLPDGTVLELGEVGQTHRVVLRDNVSRLPSHGPGSPA